MTHLQIAAAALEQASSADWLEAWATSVAAVGTVGALLWQARALAMERRARAADVKRLQDEVLADRAAQARTVIVFDPKGAGLENTRVSSFSVMLGNFGTQPIVRIVALVSFKDQAGTKHTHETDTIPVIEPNGRRTLIWDVFAHWPHGLPSSGLYSLFEVQVGFTDVYGARWITRPGKEPIRVEFERAAASAKVQSSDKAPETVRLPNILKPEKGAARAVVTAEGAYDDETEVNRVLIYVEDTNALRKFDT